MLIRIFNLIFKLFFNHIHSYEKIRSKVKGPKVKGCAGLKPQN